MTQPAFILACIGGGLAVLNIIWPHNALISTSALLIAVAVAIGRT